MAIIRSLGHVGKWPRGVQALAAVAVTVCAVLILFRPSTLSFVNAALAATILMVGLAPGLNFLATEREMRPAFPLLALTGLFYGVFFGVSAFLAEAALRTSVGPGLFHYGGMMVAGIGLEAQIMVLVGLIAALLCHRWTQGLLRIRHSPFRLPFPPTAAPIRIVAWGLVAAHFVYLISPTVRALPSVGQILIPAGPIGLGVLYVLWRQRTLARAEAIVLLVCAAPAIVVASIQSLFLTPIFMLAVFIWALELWQNGRLVWKSVIAGTAVFVIGYLIMPDIRSQFWVDGHQHLSMTEKTATAFRLMRERYFGSNAEDRSFSAAFQGIARRTAHIVTLTWVVEKSPKDVPYMKGETYKPLLTSFVPRIIWPGKPEERAGQTFADRYGFTFKGATLSLNMPWLIEMYVNFGWAGVLAGMPLVGAFLAFLEWLLVRPGASQLEATVGGGIVLPLFYQDSNVSVMTGSLFPLMLAMWILFHIAGRITVGARRGVG